jgi:predicted phosphodiesterase
MDLSDSDTILCIGDVHVRPCALHLIDEFILILESLFKKKQYDFIVLLGDTLHSHEKVHVECLNKALLLIRVLQAHAHVFLIIGNHDLINSQQFLTQNHPFNALKEWDNVTVVDMVFTYKDKYVFVPYVPPMRFKEALYTFKSEPEWWTSYKCIFTHVDECNFVDVVTPSVINGHIHDKVISQNVTCVGSIMQVGHCESPNKYIHEITQIDDKVKVTEIQLHLTNKQSVKINADDVFTNNSNCDFELDANTRLEIHGDFNEFTRVRESAIFKKLVSNGVRVVFKQTTTKSSESNPISNPSTCKNYTLETLKQIVLDKKDDLLYNTFIEYLGGIVSSV